MGVQLVMRGSPPPPAIHSTSFFCINHARLCFKQLALGRGSNCTHWDVPLEQLGYRCFNVVALVQGRLRATRSDHSYECNDREPPFQATTSKPNSAILQFELPAIDSIFSWNCHPEYESIREECDAWTLSLYDPPLPLQHPKRALYLQGLYPLFTCLFFPSCTSRRRLVLATKLNNWLFFFDDMVERADPHTAAQLVQGFQSLLVTSSLRDQIPPDVASNWGPFSVLSQSLDGSIPCQHSTRRTMAFLERLRGEVWEEMVNDMSSNLRERVVAAILSSVNATWEYTSTQEGLAEEYRAGSTKWSCDQLMELRFHDGYAMPFLLLIEYMLGIDLENIARTEWHGEGRRIDLQENVEALKLAAVKHATWVNDLLSLRNELFNSKVLSTVRTLLMRRGVDSPDRYCEEGQLEEVIRELWAMIQEQEKIIEGLMEEMKAAAQIQGRVGGNGMMQSTVVYCEEVCRGIAGNMYWSTVTARYNGLNPIPWNTPTTLSIPSHPNSPPLYVQ